MADSDRPARRHGVPSLLRERAAAAAAAAREIAHHRDLRNLELSLLCNWTAETGYLVALAVFAYEIGGAIAVGLLGLGRLLPAGVLALLASAATDRYPRETVLRVVYLVRALTAAASAVAFFSDAPGLLVLILGGAVTVVSAALRPAYWALLPSLARTPEQLTAANVLASTSEGLALLVGPAIAGLALSGSVGLVFAGAAVLFAVSAVLALGVSSGGRLVSRAQRHRVFAETIEGVKAVAHHADTRLLVLLGGAQTFVRGGLSVLIVLVALELLEMGESGVGFLSSAFGVGNLVGAVAALALVGRRRMGGPLAAGLMMWGAPIALIAVWANPTWALLMLVLPGWGNAIFDIAILTMLQRITPDEVLGRVFGMLETAVFASMAAGSIAASGLVALLGVRGALIVLGSLLPVIALVSGARVRSIDDRSEVHEQEVDLLRSVSLFASLPAVALEHLAAKLEPVRMPARHTIFRKGDPGDRFYVVASGSVHVKDGRRTIATLGVGGYFGEIALLRGVPRTATLVSAEACDLYSLTADDFLAATSRYDQCARVAREEVDARVSQAAPPRNRRG